MGHIVKYDNSFNEVALRKFNKLELDLFMSICSKLKENKTQEVVFTFEQLRALANYNPAIETRRFIKDLDSTYEKLTKLNFKIETEDYLERIVLFTRYKIDKKEQIVTIAVNDKFEYIFNELTSNFTRFELNEYVNLKSTYSKECFRRLKQFRQTGKWVVKIDDFKRLLDIPSSYRMSHIDEKVFKPIKTELQPIFKGLQIKKLANGKGRKITHIEFLFYKTVVEKKVDPFEETKEDTVDDILSYDWLEN